VVRRASRQQSAITPGALLKRLGPGFITGTSDDDPSAIATYAQAGAQFGLGQIWSALFTWPMMSAIQEMCGRIGMVTGLGLSAVIRRHHSRQLLYAIVGAQVLVNTINIGADLSGMAESGRLLLHLPYWAWLAATTLFTVSLIVFVPYHKYVSYLRVVGITLLAYVAVAATIKIDWLDVLRDTLVPHVSLDKDFMLGLVAILGATISPYEFFWQANEEVEELVERHAIRKEGLKPPERAINLGWLRWDTWFGMFVCNVIMYFIMLTAAFTLFPHGVHNVETAAQAAEALRPLAGRATFLLFALGIISAGLISIPVMAGSSAYAVAGAFNWQRSLEKTPKEEPKFYAVIAGSALAGLLVNVFPVPPFKMLFYTAILNGIISPIMIFMVLRIGRDASIMGRHTNSAYANAMGWMLFAAMSLSLAVLAFYLLKG
jgi:NRAMP (natural resistance-associated macrophage protein)-like metal ion transporter